MATVEIDLIFNEVNFLRDLKLCDNIVSLVGVYVEWNSELKEKTLYLVMKYAPYGSLLKYLQKRQKFTEEEIRTVMA
jgi:serine/threonine protein kinase